MFSMFCFSLKGCLIERFPLGSVFLHFPVCLGFFFFLKEKQNIEGLYYLQLLHGTTLRTENVSARQE